MDEQRAETLTVGYKRLRPISFLLAALIPSSMFAFGIAQAITSPIEMGPKEVLFLAVAIAWILLSTFAATLCLNFLSAPYAIRVRHDRLDIITYRVSFRIRQRFSILLPVSPDAGFAFNHFAIGFEKPVTVERDGKQVSLRGIPVSWDMIQGDIKSMHQISTLVSARIWKP